MLITTAGLLEDVGQLYQKRPENLEAQFEPSKKEPDFFPKVPSSHLLKRKFERCMLILWVHFENLGCVIWLSAKLATNYFLFFSKISFPSSLWVAVAGGVISASGRKEKFWVLFALWSQKSSQLWVLLLDLICNFIRDNLINLYSSFLLNIYCVNIYKAKKGQVGIPLSGQQAVLLPALWVLLK